MAFIVGAFFIKRNKCAEALERSSAPESCAVVRVSLGPVCLLTLRNDGHLSRRITRASSMHALYVQRTKSHFSGYSWTLVRIGNRAI